MNTFNTKEDGTHLYRFCYVEPIIDIYAYDLEQAMERYLVYCQKNELYGLYDYEADDDDEMHCYTDPTMEDPDCYPAYIRIDYLSVEEIEACVDAGGHPFQGGWKKIAQSNVVLL